MKPHNLDNPCPKTELTVEKLRSYSGFEDMPEDQAQLAIQNIKKMAQILFSFYQDENPPGNPSK